MKKQNELVKLIMSSPSLSEEGGGTFKDYLLSLRSNRNDLVAGILSSSKDAEDLPQKKSLLSKAKNIQNQTRGKLGEFLGRVALTNSVYPPPHPNLLHPLPLLAADKPRWTEPAEM